MSRTRAAQVVLVPRRPESDASFVTGLLIGVLAGAALVLILTPEVRAQVQDLARQAGLTPGGAATAPRAHAERILTVVAPPPDPRGNVTA